PHHVAVAVALRPLVRGQRFVGVREAGGPFAGVAGGQGVAAGHFPLAEQPLLQRLAALLVLLAGGVPQLADLLAGGRVGAGDGDLTGLHGEVLPGADLLDLAVVGGVDLLGGHDWGPSCTAWWASCWA